MKILIIDKVHESLEKKLNSHGFICHNAFYKKKDEIMTIIKEYTGIVIRSKFSIDQDFIDQAKKLKFIARAGSGMENINTKYAARNNIICYNAGDGNAQAVAEHALGMILSLLHKINISNNELKAGIWDREKNRGIELSNKTICIIGFGNTGSAFANLLKNFNVRILAYDKYLKEHAFKTEDMKEIFEQTDILSLHIPLTQETHQLINQEFIEKFKKDIYLINTSRGKCVNSKDLVQAIKNGKIKGACLDVFDFESDTFGHLDDKSKDAKYLQNSDNTVLTPHIAGLTEESKIKIAKILTDKIISDFSQ